MLVEPCTLYFITRKQTSDMKLHTRTGINSRPPLNFILTFNGPHAWDKLIIEIFTTRIDHVNVIRKLMDDLRNPSTDYNIKHSWCNKMGLVQTYADKWGCMEDSIEYVWQTLSTVAQDFEKYVIADRSHSTHWSRSVMKATVYRIES